MNKNIRQIIKNTELRKNYAGAIVNYIKYYYPDLSIKDFLEEFYIKQLMSPEMLGNISGVGTTRGWQALTKKYGLNRNKFQAQQLKWKTGRGDEQRIIMKSRASGVKRIIISNKLRYKILLKYKSTCQLCGAKAPEVRVEVDHIIPQAKGGKSTEDNLWVLCGTCNSGKKDRDLI